MSWIDNARKQFHVSEAPKHAVSVAQYTAHVLAKDGVLFPYHTAVGQLTAMVRAGKLNQGTREDKDSRGRRCSINVYWPKRSSRVVGRVR